MIEALLLDDIKIVLNYNANDIIYIFTKCHKSIKIETIDKFKLSNIQVKGIGNNKSEIIKVKATEYTSW